MSMRHEFKLKNGGVIDIDNHLLAINAPQKEEDSPQYHLEYLSNDGTRKKLSSEDEKALYESLPDPEAQAYYLAVKNALYWRAHRNTSIQQQIKEFHSEMVRFDNGFLVQQKRAIVNFSVFLGHLYQLNSKLAFELHELLGYDHLSNIFETNKIKKYAEEIGLTKREWNGAVFYHCSAPPPTTKPWLEQVRAQVPWHKQAELFFKRFNDYLQSQQRWNSSDERGQLISHDVDDLVNLAEQRLAIAQSNYRVACHSLSKHPDLLSLNDYELRAVFQKTLSPEHVKKALDILNLKKWCEVFRDNPRADLYLFEVWLKQELAGDKLDLAEVLGEDRLLKTLQSSRGVLQHKEKELCHALTALNDIMQDEKNKKAKGYLEAKRVLQLINTKKFAASNIEAPFLIELAYRTAIALRSPKNQNNLMRYSALVKEMRKTLSAGYTCHLWKGRKSNSQIITAAQGVFSQLMPKKPTEAKKGVRV